MPRKTDATAAPAPGRAGMSSAWNGDASGWRTALHPHARGRGNQAHPGHAPPEFPRRLRHGRPERQYLRQAARTAHHRQRYGYDGGTSLRCPATLPRGKSGGGHGAAHAVPRPFQHLPLRCPQTQCCAREPDQSLALRTTAWGAPQPSAQGPRLRPLRHARHDGLRDAGEPGPRTSQTKPPDAVPMLESCWSAAALRGIHSNRPQSPVLLFWAQCSSRYAAAISPFPGPAQLSHRALTAAAHHSRPYGAIHKSLAARRRTPALALATIAGLRGDRRHQTHDGCCRTVTLKYDTKNAKLAHKSKNRQYCSCLRRL